MRRWLLLTGGLVIWAAHFLGVYVISSLGDVVASAGATPWRAAALAYSGLCLVAVGVYGLWALRRLGVGVLAEEAWLKGGVALACMISAVAVMWQAAPLLF